MRLQKEAPAPQVVAAHEEAAAACLKLARNLAVGNPEIQGRWWRRGLVERLAVQARCDLAAPSGERSAAWCEAVPSFMANVLANNPELRAEALEALWPHGLCAVLAMCWRRPDHGFLLLQNLFSGGHRRLGQDGCVFHVILSLLRVDDSQLSPAVAAKAKDWAGIFFSSLWSEGLFVDVFRAVKAVDAAQLHTFLRAAAAVPGWGALGSWEQSTALAAESFGRLMSRLCGRKEALGLLWHTVRGLLGGLDSEDMSVLATSQDSVRLAKQLLSDEAFVELVLREMSSALLSLAATWELELDLCPVAPAAAGVLSLEVKDLDVAMYAADAFEEEGTEGVDVQQEEHSESGAFREMLFACLELAAIPCGAFPAKLAGLYLWGNVKLIHGLHHLRFGTAAVAETGAPLPKRKEPTAGDPAKAVKAALACQLVGQLRLCGNILFENPQGAEFLRISGGLPALLSHCYADPELPLLREAGVYAVRNATQHSPETRDAVRQLLAERRTRDASSAESGPLPMIEESSLF